MPDTTGSKPITPCLRGAFNEGFSYRPSPEYLDRFTRRLLRLLDEAAIDYEKGGRQALLSRLKDIYLEFSSNPQGLTLTATAQAHLDPVHLWPD